jgi:hypothetical protein
VDDVNESGEALLIIDWEKQAFLNRLVDVESAAKVAIDRLENALLTRERGQSARGLSNFVFRCGAIWTSLTGRKPSANKVTRSDRSGADPDFVIFVQELAKVEKATAPSRDQVAVSLRRTRTCN